MAVPFTQVDAFTDQPFAGNPAAVLLLPEAREERWMQAVAREMNLSETAFLVRRDDGFALRWFTPEVEVEMCGHATLASAHVLFQESILGAQETARFHTASGLLTARRDGAWIELDFPARPAEPIEPPQEVVNAIGATPLEAGKNVFDWLLVFDSEATVRGLTPDFTALRQAPVRGVIATAPATSPGYDFVSRFFAPAVGIDEDPVTGSAHTCLAPFWTQRLGRNGLVGLQASRRGGTVRVRLAGDRVLLSGQAVTVAQGELLA